MGKLAILKFGQGSFETGFPVTLRLGNEGEPASLELDGRLPATPTLMELAQTWQFSYRSRGSFGNFRQLKAPKAQITRQSSSLVTVSQDWIQVMNDWLNGSDRAFQPIRDQLLKAISSGEDVRLVIQAEQLELWQLPWHLWNLIHDHSNIDVTFSLNTFSAASNQAQQTNPQVKILVLVGDSTNIDTQTDLHLLTQHLPGAEIYIPAQVGREQLCHDLWQQSWNILFFAGHSSSDLNEGRLYLDQETYLTIDDLRYALRRAIANGLQLAIFNSCDGLELARALADLQLPAAIVMRERIPDEAAQKFLHYFLDTFAHTNQSLHLAVREAREKLHTALDDKYPCASWLPIVYQSPISIPFSWRSLTSTSINASIEVQLSQLPPPLICRQKPLKLKTALFISFAISCAVIGIRMQGILQPLELKAYDHLMQQRPIEGPDPRLLVIGMTESDVNEQTRNREAGQGSLSDETLQKLLTTLDQHHPKAIGFDIVRDQPVTANYPALKNRLASNQHSTIVAICQFKGRYEEQVGPPPEISIDRVGFNDVPQDRDKVTRLHLLSVPSHKSLCSAPQSFGLQLALRFLQDEGVSPEITSEGFLRLNQVVFKRLEKYAGGYQNYEWVDQKYDQVLINYRPYKNLKEIAETVSLRAVLSGEVKSEQVKNRIVLIGRIDDTDSWLTPYQVWESHLDNTPGVYIHAQAVSQILSAVLDQRPLIWWLPIWLDCLWVIVWGITGGVLARYGERIHINKNFAIAGLTSTAAIILYLCCLIAMRWAGWVPLIPALMSLSMSSVGVITYQHFQKYAKQSLQVSHSPHILP